MILPIHEHGRSFHLLRSSLISFFRDLKFLSYTSFTSSSSLESNQGILYYLWLLWGCCLPSFFLSLFFLCVEKGHWFELILYPATSLKLFIRFRSSLVEFLGSLIYTIISSAKNDSFTSSFPICIPLFSFCCLIVLDRTSSTILNRYYIE